MVAKDKERKKAGCRIKESSEKIRFWFKSKVSMGIGFTLYNCFFCIHLGLQSVF